MLHRDWKPEHSPPELCCVTPTSWQDYRQAGAGRWEPGSPAPLGPKGSLSTHQCPHSCPSKEEWTLTQGHRAWTSQPRQTGLMQRLHKHTDSRERLEGPCPGTGTGAQEAQPAPLQAGPYLHAQHGSHSPPPSPGRSRAASRISETEDHLRWSPGFPRCGSCPSLPNPGA